MTIRKTDVFLNSMANPETRLSLLMRLRDPADGDAWTEFEKIYRPVIVRVALLKGMQDADAQDLAQQVLFAVSRAIHRFQPDENHAKFRTWLRRVTENAILNALTRGEKWVALGDDGIRSLIEQTPAEDGPDSRLVRNEYRHEIFAWAVREVRPEFSDLTWDAFWLTAVEDHDVDTIASRLGKSRGSIYAARSRVMQRIREKIEEFE